MSALAGQYCGRCLWVGANTNADVLLPADYFSLDPERLREGFLRGLPEGQPAVEPGTSWSAA